MLRCSFDFLFHYPHIIPIYSQCLYTPYNPSSFHFLCLQELEERLPVMEEENKRLLERISPDPSGLLLHP